MYVHICYSLIYKYKIYFCLFTCFLFDMPSKHRPTTEFSSNIGGFIERQYSLHKAMSAVHYGLRNFFRVILTHCIFISFHLLIFKHSLM